MIAPLFGEFQQFAIVKFDVRSKVDLLRAPCFDVLPKLGQRIMLLPLPAYRFGKPHDDRPD